MTTATIEPPRLQPGEIRLGDKTIVHTATFMAPDDEWMEMAVPFGAGQPINVALRMRAVSRSGEPQMRWWFDTADSMLRIECEGWHGNLGTANTYPVKIGERGDSALGVSVAAQRIGDVNLVTMQFYRGGEYA